MNTLNIAEIKSNLDADLNKNIEIQILQSTPSTNDYCKTLLVTREKAYYCFAEQQSAGRGRLGRSWYSPPASNIYLSCRCNLAKPIMELNGLSLVISLAVTRSLMNLGMPAELQIKWPNDVLYQEKKLSGNIIEIVSHREQACDLIMGIGLNVNMKPDDKTMIDQPWTSCFEIMGVMQDRNRIAAEVIKQLTYYLKTFTQHGFEYFLPEWRRQDYLFAKKIRLMSPSQNDEGVVVGVDGQGYLLLKKADGAVQAFATGDSSVIKTGSL